MFNAMEPTHNTTEDLDGDIEDFKLMENIVPAFLNAELPLFRDHKYLDHGT
jgi:hypothetical protein